MENEKKDKKTKKREPDYLYDVLEAVEKLDIKKRSKENFKKEHEIAVALIKRANAFFHPGYISISKARRINQYRLVEAKKKAEVEQEKMKQAIAEDVQKKRTQKKSKKKGSPEKKKSDKRKNLVWRKEDGQKDGRAETA